MKKLLQALFWLILILAALGLLDKARSGQNRARVPVGPGGGSIPPPSAGSAQRRARGRRAPDADTQADDAEVSKPEIAPDDVAAKVAEPPIDYPHITDPFWRSAIENAYLGDAAETFAVDPDTGSLVMSALGISLPRDRVADLDRYGEHLVRRARLVDEQGASFALAPWSGSLAAVDGLHFKIETAIESELLNEIFLDGTDRLALKAPIAVWDAGMRSGIAAVCFAAHSMVARVVGFEPNPELHAAARRNLELNPTISGKISVLNSGIAAKDGFLDSQAEGAPSQPPPQAGEGFARRSVPVLSAVSAFSYVQKHSPGLPILLRLNGGEDESEILPALTASSSLHSVEAIVIETHPYVLEMLPQLRRFGFEITHVPKTPNRPGRTLASKGRLSDIFSDWPLNRE